MPDFRFPKGVIGTAIVRSQADFIFAVSGLQKRHYQKYLDGIRDSLLKVLPSIGVYKGAWTSGVLTNKDIENIA